MCFIDVSATNKSSHVKFITISHVSIIMKGIRIYCSIFGGAIRLFFYITRRPLGVI